MPKQKQGTPPTRDRGQQVTNTLAGVNPAGTTAEEIAVSFRNHMTHSVGRPLESSSLIDKYHALSSTVRDRLMDQWLETIETYKQNDVRVLGFLSAEYLLGPHLENDLLNLDLTQQTEQALESLGLDLKPSPPRSLSLAWVTAGWVDWPHVFSIRSPRWMYR